jgi:hypothetical protein
MRNLLFAVILGGLIAGCGGEVRTGSEPVYPVSGVVTYQGQPVEGADVTFRNAEKNRSAFGRTDDQGRFRLTTFSANDGAVAGTHSVTVVKLSTPAETAPAVDLESEAYVPPRMGQSTAPGGPKSELPQRYSDPASSGLTATVEADGANEFDFALED